MDTFQEALMSEPQVRVTPQTKPTEAEAGKEVWEVLATLIVLIVFGYILYPDLRWYQYQKACEAAGGYADITLYGGLLECEGPLSYVSIPGFEAEEGKK